jgi:hypothetical protein
LSSLAKKPCTARSPTKEIIVPNDSYAASRTTGSLSSSSYRKIMISIYDCKLFTTKSAKTSNRFEIYY